MAVSSQMAREFVLPSSALRPAANRMYVARTMYFFFQAEDGIRDDLVTGVQTCALPISDYAMKLPPGKDKAGGGGGGGERAALLPTKGKLPKWSMTQIAPPMVHANPDSKIDATLLGPPDLKIPSPNLDNYGDPLQKLVNGSGGPGGGSGIGTGTGTGIGSGSGAGLGPGAGGGTCGGSFHPGTGRLGYPSCS